MPDIRKQWQDFKKKNPSFEKSKNFKADAGPLMDEFNKRSLECIKLIEKLENNIASIETRRKKLDEALDQYGQVINNLAKTNPGSSFGKRGFKGMQADYKEIKGTVEEEGDSFSGDMKRLAKRAQQYERDETDW